MDTADVDAGAPSRRSSLLPFSPPLIGEEEIAEIIDTLRSDWITTGPKVARFETDFARWAEAPAALAVSSATAALHLSLLALDIGPEDGVVCTPMTFCSSVHVVEHVGARPVMVDVDPHTLTMDPDQVERALSGGSRIKAIQPVHLYGQACDMTALTDLAERYGVALVEDAAHAMPTIHSGIRVGRPSERVPDLISFSFYATKNITTGEGGMLTGPTDLIDRARTWSLHGMSRDAYRRYAGGSWYYEVVLPGFKYNLTDLQAALGLHQLRRLEVFHARRLEIVRRYDEALGALGCIELPPRTSDADHAWHLYVIRLRLDQLDIDRAAFIDELKALNISTSVHFIPVHLHPYYRDRYGFKPEDFPVALREYERIISLPLFPRMSDDDVEDVIAAVSAVARRHRR